MKKLTFLSNLWRLFRGSRKDDGSTRLRVVFDSFTCRLRVCPLKLVSVLAILLTLGVGNVRGTTVSVVAGTYSKQATVAVDGNGSYIFMFGTSSDAYVMGNATSGSNYLGRSSQFTSLPSSITITTSPATNTSYFWSVTDYNSKDGTFKLCGPNGYCYCSASGKLKADQDNSSTWHIATVSDVIYMIDGNDCYIKNTGASGFRAYSTAGNRTQLVAVYKLGSSCTSLEMSAVTATPGDRQIALSWSAVAHADSYTVSCKVKSTGVAAGTGTGSGKTGTSCTITGLTNDTEYTWSVEPVGSGTYCSSNTPATGDAIPGIYYTVTWKASGSSDVTTSVRNGTKPTFPDTPASCDLTSTTFYGWAAAGSLWSGKIDDISAKTIYTDASAMPNVSGAVTYHAVFAQSTGSGTATQAATISTSDPYISGTGWATSTSKTYTGPYLRLDVDEQYVSFTSPKGAISRFQFTYKLQKSTSCTGHKDVDWWKGEVEFYGSSDGGSNWSKITTKSESIDRGTSLGSDIAKDYTDLSSGGYNAIKVQLGKECGNLAVKDLSATYSNVTYSKYLVSCETCDDPTALGKGSFNSSTHVQPITWTSEAGKVDICYSTSSTKPSSTPGSGYTVISGETGYTDKSNTYELNVSSFAPGDYYVWARSVCSESAKSDWVAMTSNYFTLTGYTLTLNKSGGGTSSTVTGDPTWTSVVPGNQVSVTASPASGYAFESWSVSGTSSTLSSTTTNPTTFTMGSANSTVTATFSEVKVSSLTLHALKKDNTDASIFDETGSDVALAMYPTEGKTASPADPLGHTAKIEFGAVLPSDALDNTYTWSATVNGVATAFSSNDLTTNSVIEFNKSSGKLVAKAAGTAEIIITANDGSGVSAKVTITVTNVALTSVSVDPSSMNVYVGQILPVAVAYNPANVTTKGYSYAGNTNVTILNKANDSFNVRGDVVTAATNNTVTITTTSDSRTADLSVTVKPLPTVHFVDIIHNETFSDVVATVDESDKTIVHFDKTVPTHADISPAPASGNDCEKEHLHLIGWIRSDYSKVSAYMEGTGDAPTNAEITGAGAGYYYAAGAAITLTDDLHGKTFYAVWAKTE